MRSERFALHLSSKEKTWWTTAHPKYSARGAFFTIIAILLIIVIIANLLIVVIIAIILIVVIIAIILIVVIVATCVVERSKRVSFEELLACSPFDRNPFIIFVYHCDYHDYYHYHYYH